MTIIATKQKALSDVLMQDAFSVVENFNYAHRVPVDEAADVAYALGQVLIWDGSAAFRKIVAGDFTGDAVNVPAGDSVLPDGAKFAVVVGADAVADINGTVTVTTAGDLMVVLYRGEASVKKTGLVFDAGLNAAKQASVIKQLEKQGIAVKDTLQAVSSSFYGAV